VVTKEIFALSDGNILRPENTAGICVLCVCVCCVCVCVCVVCVCVCVVCYEQIYHYICAYVYMCVSGVIRALINQDGGIYNVPRKVFYCGPMFRRERPQHGRFRQVYIL